MMLLVDVGNTRIKWGLFNGGVISAHGALVYAGKPIMEVLTAAWAKLASPAGIVVANVAGTQFAENLERYCRERFNRAPEFVQPMPQACGVTNGYSQPTQLGADRWAAVIGAYHLYAGPVCIIGCGTAITVDTVTGEGRHLGGLIAPGIGVMQRALAAAAPAIPQEPDGTVTLYARDTRTAVSSGILYAAAGLVERASAEIRVQQGARTKFLLTGGDAERVISVAQGRFTLVPHLVLEGLAVLAGGQT